MEESQSSVSFETPTPQRSLIARLADVFVSPGEVFEEVKSSPPQPANWVVPLIVAILMGALFSVVSFSQPAVQQQMKEAREEQMQKMVKEGKLTQRQAEQATQAAEKFTNPMTMKLFGVVGAVVGGAAKLFFLALVLFLLGRFVFHAQVDYMKALEVCGLALMISALGSLISMFLVMIFGNMMATPGPVLLARPIEAANKWHIILAGLNLVTIWFVTVLSIGLAKLANVRVLKPALWLYGLWLLTFLPSFFFGGK